jgi:hypothetical protein
MLLKDSYGFNQGKLLSKLPENRQYIAKFYGFTHKAARGNGKGQWDTLYFANSSLRPVTGSRLVPKKGRKPVRPLLTRNQATILELIHRVVFTGGLQRLRT